MIWTPEKKERLKVLWADGIRTESIAHELGLSSRSAVLGMVRRLDLTKRGQAKGPKAEKPVRAHVFIPYKEKVVKPVAVKERPKPPPPSIKPPIRVAPDIFERMRSLRSRNYGEHKRLFRYHCPHAGRPCPAPCHHAGWHYMWAGSKDDVIRSLIALCLRGDCGTIEEVTC